MDKTCVHLAAIGTVLIALFMACGPARSEAVVSTNELISVLEIDGTIVERDWPILPPSEPAPSDPVPPAPGPIAAPPPPPRPFSPDETLQTALFGLGETASVENAPVACQDRGIQLIVLYARTLATQADREEFILTLRAYPALRAILDQRLTPQGQVEFVRNGRPDPIQVTPGERFEEFETEMLDLAAKIVEGTVFSNTLPNALLGRVTSVVTATMPLLATPEERKPFVNNLLSRKSLAAYVRRLKITFDDYIENGSRGFVAPCNRRSTALETQALSALEQALIAGAPDATVTAISQAILTYMRGMECKPDRQAFREKIASFPRVRARFVDPDPAKFDAFVETGKI